MSNKLRWQSLADCPIEPWKNTESYLNIFVLSKHAEIFVYREMKFVNVKMVETINKTV